MSGNIVDQECEEDIRALIKEVYFPETNLEIFWATIQKKKLASRIYKHCRHEHGD